MCNQFKLSTMNVHNNQWLCIPQFNLSAFDGLHWWFLCSCSAPGPLFVQCLCLSMVGWFSDHCLVSIGLKYFLGINLNFFQWSRKTPFLISRLLFSDCSSKPFFLRLFAKFVPGILLGYVDLNRRKWLYFILLVCALFLLLKLP